MARLEAISKALYYPTVERALELIAKSVTIEAPAGGRLLDFCAGEGTAAAYLAKAWGLVPYGVELHKGRAEQARRVLAGGCLHGSYHQLRATSGGFSVILLNPPYDEGLSASGEGIRQEIQFFLAASEWLTPGGLLVFIPPDHILRNWRFRNMCGPRFSEIECFRFPDPEYSRFHQTVVLARAKSTSGYYYGHVHVPQELPVLGTEPYREGRPVTLPAPTPELEFRLEGSNPYEMAPGESEGCYGLQQWDSLLGTKDPSAFERPLMEPRSGHVAMLLAAGSLNGTELSGRRLLKGSSEKIVVETVDEEAGVAIERERIVSCLSVLDLNQGKIESWRTDQDPDRTVQWFEAHGGALAEAVLRDHQPLFTPQMVAGYDFTGIRAPGLLPGLAEPEILGVQKRTAAAAVFSWKDRKGALIDGEMGVGKTTCAVAANAMARHRKVVCVVPPHLVPKWVRETNIILGKGRAVTANKLSDVDRFFANPKAQFLVLGREKAKLGARWRAAFTTKRIKVTREIVERNRWGDVIGTKEVTKIVKALCCPKCGAEQAIEGSLLSAEVFEKTKRTCNKCREPMWQSTPISAKGTKRWPLARYINRRFSGRFALILDEAHQYAAPDSDQSRAVQHLCTAATRILAMTGTLYGGRASSIFHLLYKVDPKFRDLYGYDECAKFVADHGLFETKYELEERTSRYGYKRGNSGGRVKEIPGVNPAMINLLLGYTVFLKLRDLGYELPPYGEEVMVLDHDPAVLAAARRLGDDVLSVLRENPKALGQYLQACLGYPDCPEHAETIEVEAEDGGKIVLGTAPAFPAQVWPKDAKLIEIAQEEKAQGRKVLVFFTQTNKRSPIPRVKAALEAAGLTVSVLSGSVQPDKREEWIKKHCAGTDVLLTNGRLVETGLDLIEYPTIIQYATEYNVRTLRQSTRRSWRLGQTKPVRVIYMTYAGTMQEAALDLIARKMRAAELISGDDLGGLAEFDEAGSDFFLELARTVVRQHERIVA